MITDHHAGDCPAAPRPPPPARRRAAGAARPGHPAVAYTAATVPRLARRPGRPGPLAGDAAGSQRLVVRRGGLEVPAYSVGGPCSPAVAYVDDG
jgi:hypothetical protein